jgi:ketohexokinase
MDRKKKKVLVVGLCCLDVITVCESFPQEDTDQRCLDSRWQKGGNAANTSTVIAQLLTRDGTVLGQNGIVELMCVFGNDCHAKFLEFRLRNDDVNVDRSEVNKEYGTPTSTAIVNASNGSRTILHFNPGLPEVSLAHLRSNILHTFHSYDWIHFEGGI